MISIKQLSKTFHSHQGIFFALKDINLEIQQGEIFAIIGQSGAGKSTLLRCINLLERPSTGTVTVNGVELTSLAMNALRSQRAKISMIFQHFNLVNNKTVYENIAIPLDIQGASKQAYQKIEHLLQLVELADKKHAYPSQLSGGQKQRVAIARALVTDPHLLLCDEATSALDPKTTQDVLTLLQKINQTLGLTIVLITHEMEVVKSICHRFAVLKQGRITEISSLAEVFQSHQIEHLLMESIKPQLPSHWKKRLSATPRNGCYPLCQLYFYGPITQEAVISDLSRRYDLQLNILQANIDVIADNAYGILTLQIKGPDEHIQQAMNYFNQQQLQVEILGYV